MPRHSPRLHRSAVRAFSGMTLATLFWFGSAVKGNDTGGIIPWSPDTEYHALELAAHHCHRYGKYAAITSINPAPGNFIGFVCRRDGRWNTFHN